MPPLARRTVAPPITAAVAGTEVAIGLLESFQAGGGLPEGNYRWTKVNVQLFPGFKPKPGDKSRLGLHVTLLPLDQAGNVDTKEKERPQFWSLGSKASEAFTPNQAGTGIVAIPGGPAVLFEGTNYHELLKSLYNAGMPEGYYGNDCSVLENLDCHMQNIPEPESRKEIRKGQGVGKTGEAADQQPDIKSSGLIAVVGQILAAPWESGKPKAPAPAARPVAVVKAAAPTPVAAAAPAVEEDAETAAVNCIANVLGQDANISGMARIKLRTEVFKYAKDTYGDEAAQQITKDYFGNDEVLSSILGGLGYKIDGIKVVPA